MTKNLARQYEEPKKPPNVPKQDQVKYVRGAKVKPKANPS